MVRDMGQYDAVARDYEAFVVPRLQEIGEGLVGRLGTLARASVLELAAGTGGLTRLLLPALDPDGRLVATDISRSMLSVAASVTRGTSSALTFVVADMTALPFLDATFDVVVGRFTPLQDSPPAIREAHRVLRPGGHLIFACWGSDSREQRMLTEVRGDAGLAPSPRLTDRTLVARLRRAGLEAVRLETAGFSATFSDPDAYLAYCRGFGTPPDWDAAVRRRIRVALRQALRDRAGEQGRIEADWNVRFVTAVRASRLPARSDALEPHRWSDETRR